MNKMFYPMAILPCILFALYITISIKEPKLGSNLRKQNYICIFFSTRNQNRSVAFFITLQDLTQS